MDDDTFKFLVTKVSRFLERRRRKKKAYQHLLNSNNGYNIMLVCNTTSIFNPYPTAFPYGNGMVLHFYQQQESSMTKTVHKVINKGLKAYV